MKKKWKPPGRQGRKPLNDYAKYSTIGFQMIAIILAGLFGGIKLDEYLVLEFPVFTLTFTIFGLVTALYLLFKQALK